MAEAQTTPDPVPKSAAPGSGITDHLPASRTAALFVISVLGLFLELLLIRWVSTEIRIFAYLQNIVLVVCFLGLGMGCWDSQKRFRLQDILVPLGILVTLLSVPFTRRYLGNISNLLGGISDLVMWDWLATGLNPIIASLIGVALTLGLMVLLWEIFVPFGRLLGRLLSDHPNPIAAYSVNVAGSLLGIWLFVITSALDLPPVAWFVTFALLALYFVGSSQSKARDCLLLVGIIAVSSLAGWDPGYTETHWSPYQKLSGRALNRDEGNGEIGTFRINVNNANYQEIIDLRPETLAKRPDLYPLAQRGLSQYDLPCKLHPNPATVLIVGAGSGNDVAGVLRNGAKRVVAVEIDPVIIEIGRKHHPEQPYADPRVTVVLDDARSYFATTNEKFDLIVFGLLDSHTTTAMTNARLDHYVYTRESIARAKDLLTDGGVMFLSFFAERPFIVDRMSRTLAEVFGTKPLVFPVVSSNYGRGGDIFVNGDLDAVNRQIDADPQLARQIREWQNAFVINTPGTTSVPTDDWPYLYLETPSIPSLYLVFAAALLVLFLYGRRRLGSTEFHSRWDRSSWHFCLLGAAFMLLEVQNISKAAVVLGNTWVVNAVIISGVMVMILLANALAGWAKRMPVWPVYVALVGSCLGLYFVDLSRFAFLPYATKAVVVGLLTSLPMLFSGLVFARSFEVAPRKDAALGANLFGALVGAILQSVTFVTGVKALLLIVAGLYLLAVVTRPRTNSAKV
ncbi:MAG: hypothetical protein C0467_21345 [Planctomycetaceae bacterium]|nr:hypothetical protein [Planctomycetaceae bacterium]